MWFYVLGWDLGMSVVIGFGYIEEVVVLRLVRSRIKSRSNMFVQIVTRVVKSCGRYLEPMPPTELPLTRRCGWDKQVILRDTSI